MLLDFNPADPMHVALNAYLSDMSEADKLAAVREAFGFLSDFVTEQADAQVGDITCLFGG